MLEQEGQRDLITPIILKHGIERYETVYNICEIAYEEDKMRNHLVFAEGIEGIHGFTIEELCAMFRFYLWFNNVSETI